MTRRNTGGALQKFMIAELKSVAFGFRCLQEFAAIGGFEVIEASPLADGSFWIFARVSQTETSAVEKRLHASAWLKGLVFFSPDILPVKEALYGLVPPKIKTFLAVLESRSVADLVSVLAELREKRPIELIELQPGKGDGGKSLAYITGESAAGLAEALKPLAPKLLHYEIIENPHPLFRHYFDLEG